MASILSALLIGVSLAMFGWLLAGRFDPERRQVVANLNLGVTAEQDKVRKSVSTAGLFSRITPPVLIRNLEKMYLGAGRPADWTMEKLLLVKYGAALVGFVGGYSVNNMMKSGLGILLWIGLPILGFFVPELLLKSKAIERKQKIQMELPDLLDQMTIAVRAGLGFEQAMQHVTKNSDGPLASEMARAARDIRMGVTSVEAYEKMAERTGSDDVSRFVNAIIRAEKYGISVATVLNEQAQDMRTARRQRAETKAAQVPVKVTIPMMLLILPVLFLVVLGPSAIRIYAQFFG